MNKSAVSVVGVSFQTFRAWRGFISGVTSTLESYRIRNRIISLLFVEHSQKLKASPTPFLFSLYFVFFIYLFV